MGSFYLYGPRASGSWGTPYELQGPVGPKGDKGDPGPGGPTGGAGGQYLRKKSSADFDYEWVDLPTSTPPATPTQYVVDSDINDASKWTLYGLVPPSISGGKLTFSAASEEVEQRATPALNAFPQGSYVLKIKTDAIAWGNVQVDILNSSGTPISTAIVVIDAAGEKTQTITLGSNAASLRLRTDSANATIDSVSLTPV